jgi:hypothetical protein
MNTSRFMLFVLILISCKEDPVPATPDPLRELEGRYEYSPYYFHKDLTPHQSLNSMQDILGLTFEFHRSAIPGTFTLADTPRGTILCNSMVEVADGYTFRIPAQTITDGSVVVGAPNIDLNAGVVGIDANGGKHEGVIILSEKKILILVEVGHGTERVILAMGGKRRE